MSYKTILTTVSEGSRGGDALAPAIAFAQAHDAHLEVLCFGIDHSYPVYHYGAASVDVLQINQDEARGEAVARQKEVARALESAGVAGTAQSVVAGTAGIGEVMADRGRLADLAVLAQPEEVERPRLGETFVEAALCAAHLPVLVVPKGVAPQPWPQRVAVAWDDGREALTALRRALPLLRRAREVEVVIVDPPRHSRDRTGAGHDVSTMLSRHGVSAEISAVARTMPRISDMLLQHATDRSCDLIVMGAYGHSRFRETVFGGTTRYMLSETTVPLFLSH